MASVGKRRTGAGEPRYEVRARVAGREVSRTFKRRKDADAYVAQLEHDRLRGVAVDPRAGRVSFEDYADGWLASRLVRGRPLAPMTAKRYQSLLDHHLSALAGMGLVDLTPEVVRSWHAGLVRSAGPDTAAKSYRLLRAILNAAVDADHLARNPCRIKGAGAERTQERPMLDTALVLALADAIDNRYRALLLLVGFGGLRTGEALGLERQDADILHRRVHVVRQAQELPRRGRLVTEPKSEAGRRTVVLPSLVADALVTHLDTYTAPLAEAPIFTGPAGGPLRRATLSTAWRRTCAAVGVEGLRVHDLRHHAATVMARMPGVTTKELMARIGHSSPRAALMYQHATAERDQAIAEWLDHQAAEAAASRPIPFDARENRGMEGPRRESSRGTQPG